jgi:predicted nucleic acid-binding protein
MHPFVLGEIALGSLKSRAELLQLLEALPGTLVASDAEVMHMVNERALFGRGLGWVDVHLLAATLLTPGLRLWTRDRRLHAVAEEIGLASSPGVH